MVELVLLLFPVVALLATLVAVVKNVRPGKKGRYRYSYFEKK